jgi:hypothetical protein
MLVGRVGVSCAPSPIGEPVAIRVGLARVCVKAVLVQVQQPVTVWVRQRVGVVQRISVGIGPIPGDRDGCLRTEDLTAVWRSHLNHRCMRRSGQASLSLAAAPQLDPGHTIWKRRGDVEYLRGLQHSAVGVGQKLGCV